MASWTVLKHPIDQQIAQSIIRATELACADINQCVISRNLKDNNTASPIDGLGSVHINNASQNRPSISMTNETGKFIYTITQYTHNTFYTVVCFNIDRTVLGATTVARIVASAPAYVQQITMNVADTTLASASDATPTTVTTTSNNNNNNNASFDIKRVFSLRVDVFYHDIATSGRAHELMPMHGNNRVRDSIAIPALLEFALKHRRQPQFGVPQLHPLYESAHVPVIGRLVQAIQNMELYLPQLDWLVIPMADLSTKYTLEIWGLRKMCYDTLEHLCSLAPLSLRDVRFEQTMDENSAVLIVELDFSIHTNTPPLSALVISRQRLLIRNNDDITGISNIQSSKPVPVTNNNNDKNMDTMFSNGLRKRTRDDM